MRIKVIASQRGDIYAYMTCPCSPVVKALRRHA